MRWLLPYFGVVADDSNLARLPDGSLAFAPELPAYREWIATLRDWVAQGILPQTAFTAMHSTAALSAASSDEKTPVTSGLIVTMTPYTHVPSAAAADYDALLMPDASGATRWRDLLGEETARRIAAGFEAGRKTTLRVNRLKAEPAQIAAALADAGISARRVPWSEDALVLEGAGEAAVAALPMFENGEIYMQSLSSMIPPLVLGAQAGENVLDMAAAPGGKTTQIAALTGGGALITACERNKMRAERLEYNVKKQGASRVTVMNMDARQLDDFFAFDRVLLDAPCSGSGTVTEGSRGQFSREYLDRTVKMQKTLLDKAIRLLKPGHELVYSTCSVLREENEEVVAAALKKGGVQLVPIDTAAFDGVPLLPTDMPGVMCVCPDEWYEGFFVAKMKKSANTKK